MNSIRIVTGGYPPDPCGVGDYVFKVSEELRRICGVEIVYRESWGFFQSINEILNLRRRRDVINIQLPSRGFERSLMTYLFLLVVFPVPVVLTLHEFSRKSLLGRLFMGLNFYIAKRVIFTSDVELRSAVNIFPFVEKKSVVIPIGSNIPAGKVQAERCFDVAYFGVVRPGKGIEEFVEAVCSASKLRNISVVFIGMVPDECFDYFISIKEGLCGVNCIFEMGKGQDFVADLLSSSKVTLLPFPDGVSRRRGSALAAMMNKSVVVTTPPDDPSEFSVFSDKVVFCDPSTSFSEKLISCLEDEALRKDFVDRSFEYASGISWAGVAKSYVEACDV